MPTVLLTGFEPFGGEATNRPARHADRGYGRRDHGGRHHYTRQRTRCPTRRRLTVLNRTLC